MSYSIIGQFKWNEKRSAAAVALAEGKTQQRVADEIGVARATICNWLCLTEFAAEVDRLSMMISVSSRAERLRMAMRVARQRVHEDGSVDTDKDLLVWLKFAQSETDGVKLDLSKLAATFSEDEASLAERGSSRRSDEEDLDLLN